MKNWNKTAFFIFTAIVTIAVIFTTLLMLNTLEEPAKVILPEIPDISVSFPPSIGSDDEESDDGLNHAVLSRDTIQAVIQTLKRPESYSRTISVFNNWNDTLSEYIVDTKVLGEKTLLRIKQNGADIKNIAILPDIVYIWYDSSSNYYKANRWDGEKYIETQDVFQMIPTYEDILNFDKSDIISTGYTRFDEYNGKYYIYVELREKLLGYILKYYISIESGLLEFMEKYDGDERIYIMASSRDELSEPDMSAFLLPDGSAF